MDKKPPIRKWLAIGVILFFVGTCSNQTLAKDTGTSLPISRGNWLYVGGSGPGNYTNIQDAIDDANPGDTVYVYSGRYTIEDRILINKTITLLGENKNTTIIDGSEFFQFGIIVSPQNSMSGMIHINGFTLYYFDHGLTITGYEEDRQICINISNTIITQCNSGLEVGGRNCTIYKNIITDNNLEGMITYSQNSYYTQNSIKNNYIGISNKGFSQQVFEKNTIEENGIGIRLSLESRTKIKYNNFINNEIDTDILETRFFLIPRDGNFHWFFTKWFGNYWDEWDKVTPKPIQTKYFWVIQITTDHGEWSYALGPYRFLEFDWHPAREPYDI